MKKINTLFGFALAVLLAGAAQAQKSFPTFQLTGKEQTVTASDQKIKLAQKLSAAGDLVTFTITNESAQAFKSGNMFGLSSQVQNGKKCDLSTLKWSNGSAIPATAPATITLPDSFPAGSSVSFTCSLVPNDAEPAVNQHIVIYKK